MLDGDSMNLELDRQAAVDSFCNKDQTENWEKLADVAPPRFLETLYQYGQENLIKVNVYIRYVTKKRESFSTVFL